MEGLHRAALFWAPALTSADVSGELLGHRDTPGDSGDKCPDTGQTLRMASPLPQLELKSRASPSWEAWRGLRGFSQTDARTSRAPAQGDVYPALASVQHPGACV